MKKMLLLWLMALVATTTAFAGEKDDDEGGMGKWSKSYAPVADAQDMGAIRLAQGGDGSVYVSSKWNTAFTFGEANVPAPEIATSSAILKYDKDGKERWGIALSGDVEVTCMTAGEDGTLYAAGRFMEGMEVIDAKQGTTSIEGAEPSDISSSRCGFVLKISAEGILLASKVLIPEVNAQVLEDNDNFDPMYLALDPLTVTPTKIQLDGDKVCVAANYLGDVIALNWPGAYVYSEDMFCRIDVPSMGVFTLDASDLSNPQSILYVQQTGTMTTGVQSEPVALTFVATGGNFGVAFIGYGDLTTTTATGDTKNISFATGESGELEYGMGMVMVSGGAQMNKYFRKEAVNVPWGAHFGLAASELVDGVVYMAGTYNGQLPIDKSYSYDHNYAFITAFDMKEGTAKWTKAFAEADTAVTMLVTGEEIHLATKKGVRTIDPATGDVKADKETGESLNTELIISAAASWEDEYATIAMQDKNYIDVIAMNMGDDHGGSQSGGATFGDWQKSFQPVSDSGKLGTPVTAVALDGSVYAASHWNTDFSFAGTALGEPEIGGSSVIVKYNNEGAEQWAVTLDGAATLTAMTAAADGTLYAAGTLTDGVTLTDAASTATTLSGDAFILKMSADGKLLASKSFTTAAPDGVEYWGELEFYPTKLQLVGSKLYVQANYKGDVAELNWQGSYVDAWGSYLDTRSTGFFTLSAADLSAATSLATLQATERVADYETGIACSAEAARFAVKEDGTLLVAFIGWGNLTLATAADNKLNYSFEMQGGGTNVHGFALAAIQPDGSVASLFADGYLKTPAHANEYPQYGIADLYTDGDVLYVGGTSWDNTWFDSSVDLDWNVAFVAAINLADGSVKWTTATPQMSFGTALAQEGGYIMASNTLGTTVFATDGTAVGTTKEQALDGLAAYLTAANAYVYTDEMKVYVCGRYNADEAEEIATAIESVKAPAAARQQGVRYNLSGQRVDAAYKGIVIVDGRKVMVK